MNRVTITHRAARVVLTGSRDVFRQVEEPKPGQTFVMVEPSGTRELVFAHAGRGDANRYPRERFDDQFFEWPGLGIPYAESPPVSHYDMTHAWMALEPTQNGAVRVRRMPFDKPVTGFVVGRVVRHEGQREAASTGGYYGDFTPGYLSVTRRVPLLEVVVPDPRGRATLWLVWHEDAHRKGRA